MEHEPPRIPRGYLGQLLVEVFVEDLRRGQVDGYSLAGYDQVLRGDLVEVDPRLDDAVVGREATENLKT